MASHHLVYCISFLSCFTLCSCLKYIKKKLFAWFILSDFRLFLLATSHLSTPSNEIHRKNKPTRLIPRRFIIDLSKFDVQSCDCPTRHTFLNSIRYVGRISVRDVPIGASCNGRVERHHNTDVSQNHRSVRRDLRACNL